MGLELFEEDVACRKYIVGKILDEKQSHIDKTFWRLKSHQPGSDFPTEKPNFHPWKNTF